MRELIGSLLVLVSFAYGLIEHFDEKVTLTPVRNNELRIRFSDRFESIYVTSVESNIAEVNDFLTFPRIIQELLNRYTVHKLTVTMAHGRWNLDEWGLPPQPSAPAGAQVFAEFEADGEKDANERMKFLVEALNGVLCTSISHIKVVTAPDFVVLENHKNQKRNILKRYGVLSGETTCTENLTRLRKLLACKENGLSTLLHPSKLYNSVYHSSHLVIEQQCEKIQCEAKMEVGVTVVTRNPSQKGQRPWSFADVFDRKLGSQCKIARSSQIDIIGPSGEITTTDIRNLTAISGADPFDVSIPTAAIAQKRSVVKAWSSQGGFEQQHGMLTVHITNDYSASKIQVTQIIPCYVHLRYSRIHWKCDKGGNPTIVKVLKNSKGSEAPTLLQYKMSLSAGQTCELIIPFDKHLLRLEQYPPDANHGMHIPASSVFVEKSQFSYSIHSNAILVLLPVPDFSMPFNVICFVATAFALVFGPIQLYSTLWLAPVVKKSQWGRKVHRAILLVIIVFCLYAHMMDINLNEVRRGIETYFEKLNELK
ncbi:Protein CBG23063 [Caenorhabditis briggsae]|uniref:Protein CBG23063 n=1 Tax=Caenorhabditis briggsae TaxID=6238 RepID=A8Y4S9_CAEBR|nr:Protein CBG23063 [Caenorhabditis briggsae]CAP39899.2 Protein CBG23063 [Caenorhabditis briggsae]